MRATRRTPSRQMHLERVRSPGSLRSHLPCVIGMGRGRCICRRRRAGSLKQTWSGLTRWKAGLKPCATVDPRGRAEACAATVDPQRQGPARATVDLTRVTLFLDRRVHIPCRQHSCRRAEAEVVHVIGDGHPAVDRAGGNDDDVAGLHISVTMSLSDNRSAAGRSVQFFGSCRMGAERRPLTMCPPVTIVPPPETM